MIARVVCTYVLGAVGARFDGDVLACVVHVVAIGPAKARVPLGLVRGGVTHQVVIRLPAGSKSSPWMYALSTNAVSRIHVDPLQATDC